MVSQISNMQRSSEYHRRVAEAKRLRPVADAAYLRQLSARMADVLGLPLKTARARVERMSISATIKPGNERRCDPRWEKLASPKLGKVS
jgi:hypothetical protein